MYIISFQAQLVIATVLILAIPFSYVFHQYQNKKTRIGGKISVEKTLWLSYALFFYFVLCPVLSLDNTINYTHRVIIGSFTVLIIIRGVFQLWFMFLSKNWSPKLGIGYNIFSLIIIISEILYFNDAISISLIDHHARWTFFAIIMVSLCLITDSVYAYKFYQIVKDKTYGSRGIWFASDDETRFNNINKLTTRLNIGFYVCLIVFLIRLYTPL